MAQGHTIPHLPVQKIVAVPQTVEAGLTALCLLQYRRVQREIFHSVQLGPCLQHQGGSIICGIWRAIAIFWYVLIFVNDHVLPLHSIWSFKTCTHTAHVDPMRDKSAFLVQSPAVVAISGIKELRGTPDRY